MNNCFDCARYSASYDRCEYGYDPSTCEQDIAKEEQRREELEKLWDQQKEVLDSFESGYETGFADGWRKCFYESSTDKNAYWRSWTATHWTKKYDDYGDPEYKEHTYLSCSNCDRRTVIRERFCPSCGYRMVPEEDYRNDDKTVGLKHYKDTGLVVPYFKEKKND